MIASLKRRFEGLAFAASLSLGLMIASYLRIAGDSMSVAFSNVVHDSVMAGPVWGTALARNMALFVVALSAVHLSFGAFCWFLARISLHAFPTARVTTRQWILIWLCVGTAWVLIANATFFPGSSLGAPYAPAVRTELLGLSIFEISTGLAAVAATGVLAASALRYVRTGQPRRPLGFGLLAVAGVVGSVALPAAQEPSPSLEKPHVIIIGIDSLRYDAAAGSEPGPANAPHVRRFLQQAVSFSDTTTPLARTFPSWVSILTGRHPHTTGALINLFPRERIRTGTTIADLFREHGWHTVYGIDEVRFSNIDASYGFDQTITPPIGASDFLIGWFGDTPLSNLIVNSRVGAFLFPYLHANRAAAKLYDPDEFVRRLEREIDWTQPTFLALHLTLPHWPYSWAGSPTVDKPRDDYPVAVSRADEQFRDVMEMLERRGALANALVVVLSDHGESMNFEGDSLLHGQSALAEGEMADIFRRHKSPHGHGTDVLAPEQYRVILGMKSYGRCPIELPASTVIDAPVSLEDLTPTLADLFALESREQRDGRSLLPLLLGKPGAAESFRDRIRFTESEFNPVGLLKSGKLSVSAATLAALFYTVDPETDRIEVRPERVEEILEQRQYAAFRSDELLAALPHPLHSGYQLVAVRRDHTRARLLRSVPGPRTYPELQDLWLALEKRFRLTVRASPAGGTE